MPLGGPPMLRISRRPTALLLAAALLVLALSQVAGASAGRERVDKGGGRRLPLVIGHRGASGYRPEHTLASYTLAIEMGADYIEPDLVSTKDHVLVARHENDITQTTDVADHPQFAGRKTTKTIDGVAHTGWFTEDFTLAELRTLRAKERLPDLRPANTAFDGLYQVPAFQEVIDLAKRAGVGIYPETKHPTYFDSIGLSLEEPLLATLRANGLTGPRAKVFIQSFETANLRELHARTRLSLVQLIDAIGPNKDLIVPRDSAGNLLEPTSLVRDAHRAGLVVHPWTFRRENNFLPLDFRQGNPASPEFIRAAGDLPAELRLFFRLGVDGVFSDNADTAVATRHQVFGRG